MNPYLWVIAVAAVWGILAVVGTVGWLLFNGASWVLNHWRKP